MIDLGKGEKCSGMILVALSRVHKLENLILHPFLFKRLNKVKKSKKFPNFEQPWHTLRQSFRTPNIIFPSCSINSIGNSNNNKK